MKVLGYNVRATPNGNRLRVEVEDGDGRRRTLECPAPADETRYPRTVLDLIALAEQPKSHRSQEEYEGGYELYDTNSWVKRFR